MSVFAELNLTDGDYDLRLSMTTLRHRGSCEITAFGFASRRTHWLYHCRPTCLLASGGKHVGPGGRKALLVEHTEVHRLLVRTCRRCKDFH